MLQMINAFLTAILTTIGFAGVVFIVILWARSLYEAEKTALIDALRAYFEANGENPSQFASFIDILAGKFALQIKNTITGQILGVQSGTSRAEKALTSAFLTDAATLENPAIGAILSQFPGVAKMLNKNPALFPIAQSLLSKIASKSPQNTTQPVASMTNLEVE